MHHILSVDHSFPTAGLVLSSARAGHCTILEQPVSAVNKEAAAELCDIDFYFNFCTGTAVDVGHVACTVGERERDIVVVTTSRVGMLLGQFGIGHINIGLTVKLS